MASKVYSENYAEAWIRWNLSGDPEPMYSNLGFLFPEAERPVANLANANVILNALHAVFEGLVTNVYELGPSFVLFGVATSSTDETPPIKITGTGTATGTASGSDGTLPQNTAMLVHKNAVGRGGRMYIPGVVETVVDKTGIIGSVALAAYQLTLAELQPGGDVYTTWQTDFSLSGPPIPALMHKVPTPGTGYIPREVTSLIIDPVVATQRRRLRR